MAKFQNGNLFDNPGIKVVTTNSVIKNDGKLVMGAGAALQAKQLFPGIDKTAALILSRKGFGNLSTYYFTMVTDVVGIFQTKRHYGDKSDIELIRGSTQAFSNHVKLFPEYTFNLNMPGIGYGGLKESEVYDIVKTLPDNVIIWKY